MLYYVYVEVGMKYIPIYQSHFYCARSWFNTIGKGSALLRNGSNAEYFAAFESEFNCTIRYIPPSCPIGIEFADEKYYTLFMLKWA
jgi:hypothetical protein